MKFLTIICALFVAYANPVRADETVRLTGPFEMHPSKGHKMDIVGEMKLYFEEDSDTKESKFTKLEAVLTKPTFGKSDLFSKEAYYLLPSENQIALATMFIDSPHKFFLVWVGTLQEDKKTFKGDWYRVAKDADAIKETLSAEFKDAPEDWIKVGFGSFSEPTP